MTEMRRRRPSRPRRVQRRRQAGSLLSEALVELAGDQMPRAVADVRDLEDDRVPHRRFSDPRHVDKPAVMALEGYRYCGCRAITVLGYDEIGFTSAR